MWQKQQQCPICVIKNETLEGCPQLVYEYWNTNRAKAWLSLKATMNLYPSNERRGATAARSGAVACGRGPRAAGCHVHVWAEPCPADSRHVPTVYMPVSAWLEPLKWERTGSPGSSSNKLVKVRMTERRERWERKTKQNKTKKGKGEWRKWWK